jgi:hypothetical protein
MQKPDQNRRSSGAKAVVLDEKVIAARYRFYIFLSIVLSAAFSLGLHVIFGR